MAAEAVAVCELTPRESVQGRWVAGEQQTVRGTGIPCLQGRIKDSKYSRKRLEGALREVGGGSG